MLPMVGSLSSLPKNSVAGELLAPILFVPLREFPHTFLVVSNLGKLEGNSTRSEVLGGVDSVADCVLKCASVLACGLTICNADDQDGLARLAELGQDNTVDDLLTQLGAEWCKTLVPPVGHDLSNLLLGANVSKHVRWGAVVVHETDLNATFAVSNVIPAC